MDSFLYLLTDADGSSSSATVTIEVASVDDLPLAQDDRFDAAEDEVLTGSVAGNDTPSGDGGNVWGKISNPSHGTASVTADGSFSYTPNADFHGSDSFSYTLTDADGSLSTATVTIHVTAAIRAMPMHSTFGFEVVEKLLVRKLPVPAVPEEHRRPATPASQPPTAPPPIPTVSTALLHSERVPATHHGQEQADGAQSDPGEEPAQTPPASKDDPKEQRLDKSGEADTQAGQADAPVLVPSELDLPSNADGPEAAAGPAAAASPDQPSDQGQSPAAAVAGVALAVGLLSLQRAAAGDTYGFDSRTGRLVALPSHGTGSRSVVRKILWP